MQNLFDIQQSLTQLDRRLYAILIGTLLGIVGGIIGLSLALLGPVLTIGALTGLLVGLYLLTDVKVALYGVIFTLVLLPFGTFPVKIAITPTLLDIVLTAFLLVYIFQWMTGRRQRFQMTPVHVLILLYAMWLIFTFALGLRFAMPTSTNLRQFMETLLSISLTFVLVDILRDPKTLRKLVLVIILAVGVQAFAAIVLFALPDTLSESLLVRLARIGYPDGGVIRYIEDNPALGERAIGTWVDPNALGGILAIAATMIAPQIFAQKPVIKQRWLTFGIFGAVALALFLTSSRASFLALAGGLGVIAVARYRRFIPLMVMAGALLLLLPQTQNYLDRLMQAFQGADLATQMRIGEWTDSINLIQQYPVFGVGFTGTPGIDLYTSVANMYLIMANQIGISGVLIFLITMGGVFIYGIKAWQIAKHNPDLASIHLGYHAALLTALLNAVADLYFFRLDFQSSITWFWLVVALALASSRLNLKHMETLSVAPELTVAKDY